MTTKEEIIFRTSCHPEAFGHEPEPNDQQWKLTFPLENVSNLIVLMGKIGREALMEMLVQEVVDDLFE